MPALQNTRGLTSEVLSKSSFDRSDKVLLVEAFIASQRQYVSAYASEGKREYLQWKEMLKAIAHDNSSNDKLESGPKKAPVGGGFSSPLLKPRNVQGHTTAKAPTAISVSSGILNHVPSIRQNTPLAPRRSGSPSEAHPSRETGLASKKADRKSIITHQVSKSVKHPLKISKRESGVKRKRSDSNEEREERMAQRRARRQRKKLIITPKAPSEMTMTESEEDNEDRTRHVAAPCKDKRKKTKAKKDSKNKLPAGLALMHGFNANNIGKHRLTVGLATTLGVFNKGRASLKTKVEKKAKTKAPGIFSESAFLNKVLPSLRRKRNDNIGTKHSHVMELSSSFAPSDDDQRSLQHEKPETARKSMTTISAKTITLSAVSTSSSQSSNARSDRCSKSNYESEIWDIEREFLHEADDHQVAPPPLKPKSIVMDSRAWNWSLPDTTHEVDNTPPTSVPRKNKMSADFCERRGPAPDDAVHHGNASSLAPSQSASQIPAKIRPHTQPDSPQQRSKFFVSLTINPTERNIGQEARVSLETSHCPIQEREHDSLGEPGNEGQMQAQAVHLGSDDKSLASLCSLEGAIRKLAAEEQESSIPQEYLPMNPQDLSVVDSSCIPKQRLQRNFSASRSVLYEAFGKDHCGLDYPEPFGTAEHPICEHPLASYETFTIPEEVCFEPDFAQGVLDDDYRDGNYYSEEPEAIDDGRDDCYLNAQGVGFIDNMSPYPMIIDSDPSGDAYEYIDSQQPAGIRISGSEPGLWCLGKWDDEMSSSGDEASFYDDGFELANPLDPGNKEMTMSVAPFLQGRALLLGMDSVVQGRQTSLSGWQVGSLEDAETAVAKEFQKNWYPVKF